MHSVTKRSDELKIIPLEEMFAGIFKIIHLCVSTSFTYIVVYNCKNNCCIAYCSMDPVSQRMGVSLIPLSQSNKWLMSAGILDMIKLTTTDTGLAFFKFRKRALSYDEYLIYLKDLATSYNLNFDDIKYRMQICGKPSTTMREDIKT